MPKDEYSDLRRAYAAAGGLTLRTAQRHQKQSHPDWTRFIGVQASDAVRAAEKTGAMDPVGVTALAAVSPCRPEGAPEFVDDDEAVKLSDRREAVCDRDDGFPGHQVKQVFLDRRLDF